MNFICVIILFGLILVSHLHHTLAFYYSFQISGKVAVAWIRTIKMNKGGSDNAHVLDLVVVTV